MTDIEFITEYRKLKTITDICRRVECDRANLIAGKDKKNERLVAKICKCEIIRLYNMVVLGDKTDEY